MDRRSKVMFAAFVPLALGVVLAGLAWACTPADIYVDRNWIPPGESATVTGQYFASGVPVDIFLSPDGTPSGPVLATKNGSSFSVEITIPADLAEGEYVIVGHARDGQTNNGGGSATDGHEILVQHAPPAAEEPETPPGNTGNNPPVSNNPGNSGAKNPGGKPSAGVRKDDAVAAAEGSAPGGAAAASSNVTARPGQTVKRNARNGDGNVAAVKPWVAAGGAELVGAPGPSFVPESFADPSFPAEESSNYLLYGAFLLMIVLLGLGAGLAVAAADGRKATAGGRRHDEDV